MQISTTFKKIFFQLRKTCEFLQHLKFFFQLRKSCKFLQLGVFYSSFPQTNHTRTTSFFRFFRSKIASPQFLDLKLQVPAVAGCARGRCADDGARTARGWWRADGARTARGLCADGAWTTARKAVRGLCADDGARGTCEWDDDFSFVFVFACFCCCSCRCPCWHWQHQTTPNRSS